VRQVKGIKMSRCRRVRASGGCVVMGDGEKRIEKDTVSVFRISHLEEQHLC